MNNLCKCVFTLVELLVVISIIMILASLLMPALSKSKNLSKGTLCRNNMKQIGVGIMGYSTEYNDFLPGYAGTVIRSGERMAWDYYIVPYITQNADNYILKRKGTVFSCASDRISRGATDPENDKRSYVSNAEILKASSYIPVMKMIKVRRPSNTIMLGEFFIGSNRLWGATYAGMAGSSDFPTWPDNETVAVRYAHDRSQNFLFGDLHVKSMSPVAARNCDFVP